MGALHHGHDSLIRLAREVAAARGLGGGVVVSIFVNPAQFNDPADFTRYPRTLDADLDRCREAGADAVWVPEVGEVYPEGAASEVPRLPPVADGPGLEDAHRPGHFAGVARVVLRLFELVRPDASVFGTKDWQQLQLVRALGERGRHAVEIVPAPTVREPDGLAASSRNALLSGEDRLRAASIPAAMREACGAKSPEIGENFVRSRLVEAGLVPEYAAIRDGRTLGAPVPGAGGLRLLIAARAGSVRLIDNCPWPEGF